jgi:hydroxyacylglutathione hydrolase
MCQLSGMIVPVTPFEQNCAILWDDTNKQAVVVDPGGDVERILSAIDRTGAAVERIWLTHGHLDHAGGAAELQEMLRRRSGDPDGMPIEGPDRRDEFLLQGLEAQDSSYGFAMRDVTPDRWLREGDGVAFGEHRFDVLHCPGHTPGHVVFVNRAARFALVGDVLFQVRWAAPISPTATMPR